jgi:hypothetical protein
MTPLVGSEGAACGRIRTARRDWIHLYDLRVPVAVTDGGRRHRARGSRWLGRFVRRVVQCLNGRRAREPIGGAGAGVHTY